MPRRGWLFNGTPGSVTRLGLIADDSTVASAGGPGDGVTELVTTRFEGQTALLFRGAGTGNPQVYRLPLAGSNAIGWMGFWHYAAVAPDATYSIVNVRHASGQMFRMTIAANGSVGIQSGTGAAVGATAAGAWQPGRWNRIELLWDTNGGGAAAGVLVRVAGPLGDGAVTEIFATGLGAANAAAVDIGTPQQASSTWEHVFDAIYTDDGLSWPPPFDGREVSLEGAGALGSTAVQRYSVGTGLSGAGVLSVGMSEIHRRGGVFTGSGSLAGAATSRPVRQPGLSGRGTLSARDLRAHVTPPIVFTYWEKRRKDFGPMAESRRREYMPFLLESEQGGVSLVRTQDGVIRPVDVVTEEIEALEGVRIYYGGRRNAVTPDEAQELEAAGYGDYLTYPPEVMA
jgi:hypothetical protein